MVEPTSGTAPTVTALQAHLRLTTARWLTTRPHMSVNFSGLAGVVAEILTTHTTALRATNEELLADIDDLEAELDQLRGEHASPLASRCATLWRLLKEQTRNAKDLRTRLTYWQILARTAREDADRADREVRAALGTPETGGSTVEWAKRVRAESDHRETEIIDLTIDRDRAEAHTAALQASASAQAGGEL